MNGTPEAKPSKRKLFLAALESSLNEDQFVELRLTNYVGDEPELDRRIIRSIVLKDIPHLSIVSRYRTRDVTSNYPIKKGLRLVHEQLGTSFRSAHLFTTQEDVQLSFSRKGKARLGRSAPSRSGAAMHAHDRGKKHIVDPGRPYLKALGITHGANEIIPAMARKWKQINRFIEIFAQAVSSSELVNKESIRVVDFGSGKGYLTFAMYDYLESVLGVEAQVVGIELRESLVTFCSGVAEEVRMKGLRFQEGDLRSAPQQDMDALIALHACDTATDLAIHLGIRGGAELIVCAPCCHKEIRKQIQAPEILQPMLKFGVHLGQEADMVTDALRALLLEAHGYKTRILEFVSLEHTAKNKMILAIRGQVSTPPEEIHAQIDQLKTFYGIEQQMLETLLRKH